MSVSKTFVGVSTWAIPRQVRDSFSADGSQLQRYSHVFNAVEINSSFYREHKAATYARWAALVPDDFRFSVKLSQFFTREKALQETGSRLNDVLNGISALGPKWGILLVQLPPKLEFHQRTATRFISALRKNISEARIVWEPRHPSWASSEALRLLAEFEVSKVLADPEPCPTPRELRPLVEQHVRYFRLHGSPVKYRSRYPRVVIDRIFHKIRSPLSTTDETWCVFDNTAFGHGIENGLELRRRVFDLSL